MIVLNSVFIDIMVVVVGCDIVYLNVIVVGFGNIEISVGCQLCQEDVGSIVSFGGIVQGDICVGVSIVLMVGNQQIDFVVLCVCYLDFVNFVDLV